MTSKNYIFIHLILLISTCSIFGQADCGTAPPPPNWQINNKFHKDFVDKYHVLGDRNVSKTNYLLPVTVHILGNSNGTGLCYNQYGVMQTFCKLNRDYDSTGIQFYIDTILYQYNTDGNAGTNDQNNFFESVKRQNTINCFIVGNAAVHGTRVCGYYYGYAVGAGFNGTPDIVVLDVGCIGPNSGTTAHEMGHYLSLPHTFYGWEGQDTNIGAAPPDSEKVDGTNCTTTGDGICDTGPDYISNRWNCNANGRSGPVYTNSTAGTRLELTDPNGTTFTADGNWFMSYSNDGCMNRFSAEQVAKMKDYIDNQRADLLVNPAPFNYGVISDTIKQLLPVRASQNHRADSVQLVWNRVGGAQYYVIETYLASATGTAVQAKDRFITSDTTLWLTNLTAGRFWGWQINPINYVNPCVTPFARSFFRTAAIVGIEETVSNISDLSLSPNPTREGEPVWLRFNAPSTGESLLQLFNAQGQSIQSWQEVYSTGENVMEIPLADIPAGIYYVCLKIGSQIISSKIVKL